MRILITADLHYRPSQRENYLEFARWVQEEEPDCFIIAGDVGHPLRLFRRGLQLFHGLSCPRLLIAGNHDVYRGEYDSWTLWEEALPQVARQEGFIWLEARAVTLPLGIPPSTSRLGICGTIGWYDYSSRAPHLAYDEEDYRTKKGLVNHDADYVDWPWSDVAVARYLTKGFATRLARLNADPTVSQILVITHVPIFEPAIPVHPENQFWSLLSAYLGNFTLGEIVRNQPKVTHVVSGHIHRSGQWTVPGCYGPIEFHLVGSQQGAPVAVSLTFSDRKDRPGNGHNGHNGRRQEDQPDKKIAPTSMVGAP